MFRKPRVMRQQLGRECIETPQVAPLPLALLQGVTAEELHGVRPRGVQRLAEQLELRGGRPLLRRQVLP
ncbi:hypothetical protein [Archangium violaceum]|nr:hypothetical protein [Archangium violaceum]